MIADCVFHFGCRMLEDQTFAEIVCWGYTGDSFVVKVSHIISLVDLAKE